jgi:hypothetical protein
VAVFMERPNGDGWAHLVSDLHGEPGRAELRSFLRFIGVRRPLHRAHTYAEHCDIRGTEISHARNAGAEVISWRELARLLREKRHTENSTSDSGRLLSGS